MCMSKLKGHGTKHSQCPRVVSVTLSAAVHAYTADFFFHVGHVCNMSMPFNLFLFLKVKKEKCIKWRMVMLKNRTTFKLLNSL